MIREQHTENALFYSADEITRPARSNFWLRLNSAVPDWKALAAPFAQAFCADRGRPTDPVVHLKIFLVGYLENITYDTDLAERISDSLAIREFLGYGLTEPTPDHSSISRNRALIGERCDIAEVLAAVVALCRERGLVNGEEVAVDATLIPANASLSSLRSVHTGKSVREHFQEVRERNQLGEAVKPSVSNAEFRSTSDPDARLAQKVGSPRDMYYKATHVTDSKAGIIVAADCATADVADHEAAGPVLAQAQQTLAEQELELGTVIADAGYDDADFHAEVEALGATPLTNFKSDTNDKPAGFKKANFSYDADRDCYVCPAGKVLHYQGNYHDRRRYSASPADCHACPQQVSCLGPGRGRHENARRRVRVICRHQHEASRERNLARCHTDAGRQALRRRRHIVEPPFGHMKTYGGVSLINCRGGTKARVKVVLAAVAWDLIKLVRALAGGSAAAPSKIAAQVAAAVSQTTDTAIIAAANADFNFRALVRHFLRWRSSLTPKVTCHYQLATQGPFLR